MQFVFSAWMLWKCSYMKVCLNKCNRSWPFLCTQEPKVTSKLWPKSDPPPDLFFVWYYFQYYFLVIIWFNWGCTSARVSSEHLIFRKDVSNLQRFRKGATEIIKSLDHMTWKASSSEKRCGNFLWSKTRGGDWGVKYHTLWCYSSTESPEPQPSNGSYLNIHSGCILGIVVVVVVLEYYNSPNQ